jgi:hypothetical protein
MAEVEGRRKLKMYLPGELVMGNELDPLVRDTLPFVASFTPSQRNEALEKVKTFLQP